MDSTLIYRYILSVQYLYAEDIHLENVQKWTVVHYSLFPLAMKWPELSQEVKPSGNVQNIVHFSE